MLFKNCQKLSKTVSAGSRNAVAADTSVHQVQLNSARQIMAQVRRRRIRK